MKGCLLLIFWIVGGLLAFYVSAIFLRYRPLAGDSYLRCRKVSNRPSFAYKYGMDLCRRTDKRGVYAVLSCETIA